VDTLAVSDQEGEVSHLSPITQHKCKQFGCKKKVTYELINDRSSCIGVYCTTHGLRALEVFQQQTKALSQKETP